MATRTRKSRTTGAMLNRQPRLRGLWELRVVIVIGLASILTSCGAQWHLKRAIAKDPEIVKDMVVRVDTTIITKKVNVSDTIRIKEVDTIQIVKNGVVIDIQRSYDTIMVDVECPPDTVRIIKEVEVPQYIPEKKNKNIGFGVVLGFIFALVLISTILRVLRK